MLPFPDHGDGNYFFIVPDNAAGQPDRYTVYKLPPSPSQFRLEQIEIIGRELDLETAKRVIKRQP